jgi:hypothetical protein
MKLRREQPQKSQTELARSPAGEASEAARSVAKQRANHEPERSGTRELMEAIVQRDNLLAALKRVKTNDGAPGIDGMTCDELPAFLRANWPSIRERLLSGKYKPTAVRRHTISKPDGGERKLGIPTVLDRFVQQAIAQVLSPLFEPTFSPFSYGFRPGRSAIDAIDQAQRYVDEGRVYVVDVDIEAFFDNVNHDVLMARLAKRIEDKRLLLLIRRFLQAGMMDNGVRVRSQARNASRRPSLSAAGERALGRGGQGAGVARTRLRALRRRLQRVPPLDARGGASDGAPPPWRSTSPSPSATSTSWESPDSPRNLNSPNRRMRTRLSGGVAGVPRDFLGPLCRFGGSPPILSKELGPFDGRDLGSDPQ